MAEFILQSNKDLSIIRKRINCDRVLIQTKSFKYSGLLPFALRAAIFALRQNGILEIRDEPDSYPYARPYEVNFSTVRMWTFRVLGADTELLELVPKEGRIVLKRTKPITNVTWSAGVVFSGLDSELPHLERCVHALNQQSELSHERGGQIVVCGPEKSASRVEQATGAAFLPYERSSSPRFLIGAKKNYLAAHLRGSRLAIMHARIVLDPNALAQVPREFDVGSPNIEIVHQGRNIPYLSLCFSDSVLIGKVPVQQSLTLRDTGVSKSLDLYRRGPPYVDGGCFFASSEVYARCPLDEHIAWGEGEDVEWCARLASNGYCVELFPEAMAISQTSKFKPSFRLSQRIERPTRMLWRHARHVCKGIAHRLKV